MSDIDSFIKQFLTQMDNKVSNENLRLIETELSIMLSRDYEVKHKETLPAVTGEEFPFCYKAFMVTKKLEGRTDATLEQYKYQIEKFLRAVKKPVEEIQKEDIVLYLYQMREKGAQGKALAASSVDNIRLCLNSFFSWSQANGYISNNPCASIARIKGEVKEREPFEELEIETIRNAIFNYNINKNTPGAIFLRARDMALFEFLYSTGCRVGEAYNMNISDINRESTPPEVTVFGKGQKYRNSYLNAKAIFYIDKYLALRTDNDPALFVTARCPHTRLTITGIENTFKKYEKMTNIRIYPHRIRHTTATQGLKHGMSVQNLQAMLGHVKPETTMIYAHLANEELKYSHSKYIH